MTIKCYNKECQMYYEKATDGSNCVMYNEIGMKECKIFLGEKTMNKVILENLEKELKDVEESFTVAFKNMQKYVDELKKQIESEKIEEDDPYLVEGCYVELTYIQTDDKNIDIFKKLLFDENKTELSGKGYDYDLYKWDYKVLGTPWDFAPNWAEWVAVDEEKSIYFYESEPEMKDAYWENDDMSTMFGYDYTCKDWKNSLRKRPKWAKRGDEK